MKDEIEVIKKWLLSPVATTSDRGYACDAQIEQMGWEEMAGRMEGSRLEFVARWGEEFAEKFFPAEIVLALKEISQAPMGKGADSRNFARQCASCETTEYLDKNTRKCTKCHQSIWIPCHQCVHRESFEVPLCERCVEGYW